MPIDAAGWDGVWLVGSRPDRLAYAGGYGVFAGIAIVINDNNKITFGVGQAPVNPCDPDVTVNIIVDRVNEDQYLTGFTYSFVDIFLFIPSIRNRNFCFLSSSI